MEETAAAIEVKDQQSTFEYSQLHREHLKTAVSGSRGLAKKTTEALSQKTENRLLGKLSISDLKINSNPSSGLSKSFQRLEQTKSSFSMLGSRDP